MRAHEIERIGVGILNLPGGYRHDCSQQLIAMSLRFRGEFRVDRVPVFGAFALQELERVPPDFVASIAQANHDAGRKRISSKLVTPSANEPVGFVAGH
jgi:hypothetical protein